MLGFNFTLRTINKHREEFRYTNFTSHSGLSSRLYYASPHLFWKVPGNLLSSSLGPWFYMCSNDTPWDREPHKLEWDVHLNTDLGGRAPSTASVGSQFAPYSYPIHYFQPLRGSGENEKVIAPKSLWLRPFWVFPRYSEPLSFTLPNLQSFLCFRIKEKWDALLYKPSLERGRKPLVPEGKALYCEGGKQ